ncbi:hypothetical protein ACT7DF_23615 [Bacillus cereus]
MKPSLQENLQGGGVQQFLFMNDHTKTFELSKYRFEDTISLEQAFKIPAHHAIISVRAGEKCNHRSFVKWRHRLSQNMIIAF